MRAANLLSIRQAIGAIEAGTLTPAELLEACRRQIDRLDPQLRAFITVAPEAAGSGPARGGANVAPTLEGVPIAVKDLIETKNLRTTAGSRFFKDYLPTEDAAVVQRIKDAGAVIIGKTNTHEIALGVTTQNPHYGSCRNPWDTRRIPGGSSGGSAVAVATGMALGALGTDTGGSIRIPASLCGVVGLKPTYGRVSLRGVFPLSWNLDHLGPLTRTAEDAARLLQVIAGYDSRDPGSALRDVDDYLKDLKQGIRGWRIGVATGDYISGAAAEVLESVDAAADLLANAGGIIERADVSFLREAALANGLMTQVDGAAYHRDRLDNHPEVFGEDVRTRLQAGRDTTSVQYSLALRTQAELKRRLEEFFQSYDVLVLPTTPITAPLAEGQDAVAEARRLTRFTAPFNLTGVPAISLPCRMSPAGLPVGLQMVAPAWQEARLLRAAYAYEQASTSAPLVPPLAE